MMTRQIPLEYLSAFYHLINRGVGRKQILEFFVLLSLMCGMFFSDYAHAFPYLTPQDIKKITFNPADFRLKYGNDVQQFGDLRLPKGTDLHPVLIVIHGGCWVSTFADLNFMSAFAEAFTEKGIATWNIEYRCIDKPGGGWPGTFQDVGNAVDYLRTIAKPYHLDLNRVVVVGHSAGGHLALWAAARHKLPKNSILATNEPLQIRGVIDLAGPGDLESFILIEKRVCKEAVVTKLLGGTPSKISEAIPQGSPYAMLPLKVKQVLIIGDKDPTVPAELSKKYVTKAKEGGDDIRFILVEDVSHFEVIAPGSKAWPIVENTVISLMDIN